MLVSAPWYAIPTDNADGAGMVAHLHALFESRELLYGDEYRALGMSPLFAFVTERGVVSNHWPAGASFVQAPGWLLGRGAASMVVGEGISERAATWILPVLGVRVWACLALAWLLGRVFVWLEGRGFGRGGATLIVVASLLGTPLLYYATEAPQRPHLWGAIVVAVLTMRWLDALEDPRDRGLAEPMLLASLAGLAAAIRPQLAPLCLLVAVERWYASADLPPGQRARTLARHGGATALAWAVWPLVVFAMQRWMYGDFTAHASGAALTHHVRAFLLSTHHGALIWCPVLVLGALGLAIGATERQRGAIVLIVLLAVQVWLNAGTRELEPYAVLGTRTWAGGTAFGPRKLVDATPLMLAGVVWIDRWVAEQGQAAARWRRRLAVATGLAIVPTTLLAVAAWLDPNVTSTVLDGERFAIALSLPFDPENWTAAAKRRALPHRVPLTFALVVGLPLASLIAWDLRARLQPTATNAPAELGSARVWSMAAATIVAGLLANAWVLGLRARSDAQRRQPDFDVGLPHPSPAHEQTVAAIPAHQALLRRRLGDGV